MSTSDGNVWLRPLSLTRTLLTVPVIPETETFDGYGVAGAPVAAPVPVAGMVIAVVFENVVAVVSVPPALMVKLAVPRNTAPSVKSNAAVKFPPHAMRLLTANVKLRATATPPIGLRAP